MNAFLRAAGIDAGKELEDSALAVAEALQSPINRTCGRGFN
jgi:hypothetical protein